MRHINEIIIHCAATHPTWWEGRSADEKRDEIRRWHVQDNGWNDIGYHWIIDRDGTVVPGREEAVAGAHAKGHNANSIGVCLIGGHGSNENDAFSDNYTPEQERSLRLFLERKRAEYPSIKKITGHNQYAAKACPGFSVPRWLAHKPAAPQTAAAEPKVSMSAGQVAAGAGTVLTGAAALDGTAQLVVIGLGGLVVLVGLVLLRDEIRDWVRRARG